MLTQDYYLTHTPLHLLKIKNVFSKPVSFLPISISLLEKCGCSCVSIMQLRGEEKSDSPLLHYHPT